MRGIEIATYSQSNRSNPADSPATIGGEYNVLYLYKIVNGIPRKDGELKYTAQEKSDYQFNYTEQEDGTLYSLKEDAEETKIDPLIEAINKSMTMA